LDASGSVKESVMKRLGSVSLRVAYVLMVVATVASGQEAVPPNPSLLKATSSKLPIYFIQNRGVYPDEVAYYVQGADKTLFFTKNGITFRLNGKDRGWVVKLEFVGANPDVVPRGEDRQRAVFSYFRGPESEWKTGLRTFARVVYENLWPGIDLVYRGDVRRLKYDLIVRPGADPGRIGLRYRGATEVAITDAGSLRVETPLALFEDEAPVARQVKDGRTVDVRFVNSESDGTLPAGGAIFGFRVGRYDRTSALVIDPALLVYCGYIGGADLWDWGAGIAIDSGGHAYVAGTTYNSETTFPVAVGPDLTFNGKCDAFVAKVDPGGKHLIYCGYIGGASVDYGAGVAVDPFGGAYVTGTAASDERTFPVKTGPDLTHNGFYDVFVAKLNAPGTGLEYCGYIGGSQIDQGHGIALDASGAVYVVGEAASTEQTFPVKAGPDLTYNGTGQYGWDGFVAKVNPAGTGLVYCGYIGGSGGDCASRVAVDRAGYAYVTGTTDSSEASFPVVAGPDLTHNGGRDAFVAKVAPTGAGLVCCGYIGGSGVDWGQDIDLDVAGSIYVAGSTSSDERTFPVRTGPDLTYNGNGDAFVAKLDSRGTQIIYCGYIGGSGLDPDQGYGVAADAMGNAYVAGEACSDEKSFPVMVGPDLTYNGPSFRYNGGDGFVAKVNYKGTAFDYCGYIGGDRWDVCFDVAADVVGNAYVTGLTESTETTFPVTVGPDLTYNDPGPPTGGDAFVAAVGTVFLTGSGVPRPGGRITLSLHAYEDPSRPYQLGSSFGSGPIPIGPRRLSLDPDLLLIVSTSDQWPMTFRAYRGVLDGKGGATAAIQIPSIPALVGLRIHTAYVTVDPQYPQGIKSISNTFIFTITK